MSDLVKVYDSEGIERNVHAVDATEIIANGGTWEAPKEWATIGATYTDEDAKAHIGETKQVNRSKGRK